MKHTRHSWVRQDSFLRHYLRKSGSQERTATSPTLSSADPPEMLLPQEVRRRYVDLLTSQRRFEYSIHPSFFLSATLRFKLPRGVQVSHGTEVKSSRMVMGKCSRP